MSCIRPGLADEGTRELESGLKTSDIEPPIPGITMFHVEQSRMRLAGIQASAPPSDPCWILHFKQLKATSREDTATPGYYAPAIRPDGLRTRIISPHPEQTCLVDAPAWTGIREIRFSFPPCNSAPICGIALGAVSQVPS